MAAQPHRHEVHQLAVGLQIILFRRQRQRVAARLPARDDGNQVHLVAVGQDVPDDGVTRLVDGDHALVALRHLVAALLRTHLHAGNRLHQRLLIDGLQASARRQNRGFIHDVFQLRAGGEGHALGDILQIHIIREGLALGVHLQDGNTPRHIGVIDENRAVKAAGTQQRGVKNVAAVRRRHDDDTLVDCEAVHLDQQLVQRLLALVVSAAQTRAAMAADRVNLINKDDGRGSALGLVEQVTDAARAHAHEHLHKVRAGNGKERHARLARNRLRQQGFARAGRADEQHALRNARAHVDVRLGVAQEVHHFLEFFLLFLRARDIGKRHLVLVRVMDARPAAAEVHHLAVAAGLRAHNQPEHHAAKHQRNRQRNQVIPPRGGQRLTVDDGERQILDGHLVQRLAELRRLHLPRGDDEISADDGFKIIVFVGEIRVGDRCRRRHAHQRRAADGDGANLPLLNHRQQLGIGDAAVTGIAAKAVGEQHRNGEHHQQQNRDIAEHPARLLQCEHPPSVPAPSACCDIYPYRRMTCAEKSILTKILSFSGKNRLIYSRAAPYTRLSSTPISGRLRYFSAKSSP